MTLALCIVGIACIAYELIIMPIASSQNTTFSAWLVFGPFVPRRFSVNDDVGEA